MKKSTLLTFAYTAGILFAGTSLRAATVLIDFGGNTVTGNWNNLSDPVAGTVTNAIDNTGANSGISVAVTTRFNTGNFDGTTSAAAPYPTFATADSFYGNARLGFNNLPVLTTGVVTFTGLNINTTYDFKFFASRNGVTDNRESRYTLTGAGAPQFAELNASNNIAGIASVTGISPNASGVITLTVGMGDDNNNVNGFYYLGATEISYVPEPTSSLLVCAGAGLMIARRRRI